MSKFVFAKKTMQGASPEELDHLMVIVRWPLWFPLGALAFICLCAIVWSIFGTVPISVNGVGVLINPGNVKDVQAQGSGQIISVNVSPGEILEVGTIVAEVQQLMKQQSVDQARENYEEIKLTNTQTREVNSKRFRERLESLNRQGKLLKQSRRLSQSVHNATQERFDSMSDLVQEGLASKDQILGARSALVESQTKMSNYDVQLQGLELEREQATQDNLQNDFQLASQIADARRNLDRLELDFESNRFVRSGVAGRVLEIKSSPGRIVSYGTPILSVETVGASEEIVNLCFFPVKDGKRIREGMQILITPTTVKRERYGGIIGEVTDVSSFPISREAAINLVGSKELTGSLMSKGALIEVKAIMMPNTNSDAINPFKWSSKDPPVPISQGMVTMNRIAIENRAPITYVMPLLRSWFQGQRDDFTPNI